MNIAEYSSSTIFSYILMTVVLIVLLALIINYLVKLRVAKSTERYTRINGVLKQSLDMGELTIAYLNLQDNKFYNFHGDHLSPEGEKGLSFHFRSVLLCKNIEICANLVPKGFAEPIFPYFCPRIGWPVRTL